jgi:hypothetical protein
MDKLNKGELFSPAHKATIAVNVIAILLGIFITIFYIICKVLHTYPCYNKLTVNLIILVDNIIRVIPLAYILKDGDDYNFLKYGQAFLLIFFDKFFLIILTNQILIQYFGIMHTNFYFDNEKKIFFIGTGLSAIISIILAAVFIKIGGYVYKEDDLYYYGDNKLSSKITTDTIYYSILLVINVFCLVIIIINSSKWNKKSKKEGMENIYYEHNFIQSLLKFIVNTLTYVISFLIIYRCLSGYGITDLIYLINCLIVNIVYCFNKFVNNAFCNTFCICIYKNLSINQQNVTKSDTYNIMNDEDDDDDDY